MCLSWDRNRESLLRISCAFQSGSFWTLPNLRRLEMQIVAGMVEDELNLATLLSGNEALDHLHLHLSPSVFSHTASAKGGVLKHLLQDKLPLRLKSIFLEGDVIENLHPTTFKVSGRRLLKKKHVNLMVSY